MRKELLADNLQLDILEGDIAGTLLCMKQTRHKQMDISVTKGHSQLGLKGAKLAVKTPCRLC